MKLTIQNDFKFLIYEVFWRKNLYDFDLKYFF